MITIYHNPRCRKSRETLNLIEESGVEYEVVEYLKDPLTSEKLEELVERLGITPYELLRRNESEFKDNFKGKDLSDEQWIQAITTYPKLMERPIVDNGSIAVIGRPPENVLEIL